MVVPDTFAFHLTYTCPLACAHCCFRSGPKVKDTLDPALVLRTIDLLPDTIDLVAFTGGEPFLHGADLPRYIARAAARGFRTRVVTSGYFATSPAATAKRLQPCIDAGLDELSISWDEFHEAFVEFPTIANLIHFAVPTSLRIAVNITQLETPVWSAQRLREELRLDDPMRIVVAESALNRTGRADDELGEQPLKEVGYLGPCPYVLTGPTLSAKGKLMPCCGVIPKTDRLIVASDPEPERIPELIDESLRNDLYRWLYLRGPYAIMEWIAEAKGVAIPPREVVGGNCEACKLLLADPAFETHIDEVLAERAPYLAGEEALMDALADTANILPTGLWRDRSLITSRAAPAA